MFLDVPGCPWMFLDVPGCSWMFLDVDENTSYYSSVWSSSQQAMSPHRRKTNHMRYFETHLSKQWARIDEQQSKDTSYYSCVWPSSQQAMRPHRRTTNHLRYFATHLSKQWGPHRRTTKQRHLLLLMCLAFVSASNGARIDEQQIT